MRTAGIFSDGDSNKKFGSAKNAPEFFRQDKMKINIKPFSHIIFLIHDRIFKGFAVKKLL